jgi:molecular chaperone DnaK
MGKIIGIDLGTTNSCVAIVERSGGGKTETRVLPNSEGARTTPSVVAVAKNGDRLVGQAARRQAVTNPKQTIAAAKRLMGRKFEDPQVKRSADRVAYEVVEAPNGDAWVRFGDRTVSPAEISAEVLIKMRETAEAVLGETVTEAVITVPAYFDDAQRQATKVAGAIAGLEVKRILNEPTAAALAYGLDKEGSERVVVYDLGGGTFDVTVLEITGGVFHVKSTSGDCDLGGEDFDERIVRKLAEEYEGANGVDLRKDPMALQRLREAAERAKHELSSSLETEVNLPFIGLGKGGEPLHLVRTMTRTELEQLTADLVERTLGPCRDALAQAHLSPADVQNIVLVGGMTRMPAVQRAVKSFFGKEPHRGVNPDEVVAVGAALQGAALGGGDEFEVLLLDVTPLSLGVETGGGVFTPLIARNTTVPCEKSEIFTTSVDNQPFVPVHVLQGERPMAADNRSLGRFELTGIPPAPRGLPMVQVTFRIDENGVVSVDAKDLGTGRAQAIRIQPSSGLSKEEIDARVAEADKNRKGDEERRAQAELHNQAEALLHTTEQALEGYAQLVSEEELERAKQAAQRLRTAIEAKSNGATIRVAYQELEAVNFALADALYGGLGGTSP